jgi:hypothetical protein
MTGNARGSAFVPHDVSHHDCSLYDAGSSDILMINTVSLFRI